MHEGSRRKASWKDPDGCVISATPRADAATRLLDLSDLTLSGQVAFADLAARLLHLRNQILSDEAAFADLAARHSDCSSAKHGDDLGCSSKAKHLLLLK